METISATDVFVPNGYPELTYVERNEARLEQQLTDALATPGQIVSLSGPSKSGKSVLVEKVVGRSRLFVVAGASVQDTSTLWSRALHALKLPTETIATMSQSSTDTSSDELSGGVGLASVFNLGGKLSETSGEQTGESQARRYSKDAMTATIDAGVRENRVMLIDDFHYIADEAQSRVAEEIKEAARRGLRVCTASVPHRRDEVLLSNPELQGRVESIRSMYWKKEELLTIAENGFPLLNLIIPDDVLDTFARESSGSPQLMQNLCLTLCFVQNCRSKKPKLHDVTLEPHALQHILHRAASKQDYSSVLRGCHSGPKRRGKERNILRFKDGSVGDRYRGLMLAVKSDPPTLSFPTKELESRLKAIIDGDDSKIGSITQACHHVSQIAMGLHPKERLLDWDSRAELLTIVNPHFLFYIRWSDELERLGRSRAPA